MLPEFSKVFKNYLDFYGNGIPPKRRSRLLSTKSRRSSVKSYDGQTLSPSLKGSICGVAAPVERPVNESGADYLQLIVSQALAIEELIM